VILVLGLNPSWQKVGRLSRLARGEVNRLDTLVSFASGKGPDVVRALTALDGAGEAVGYAGGSIGRRLIDDLTAEGLACRFVEIADETRGCFTLVEPDGSCTEIIDPGPRVTEAEREEMRRLVLERLADARVFVVAGTAPDGETEDCYAALVSAARDRGIPVVLDSAGRQARRALDRSPDVVKVNAHELGELSGAPVDSVEHRVAACRSLASRHGVRWFFVSRGAQGIEAFDGTHLLRAVPPSVEVANAIGSGDAATAGVAWTLHEWLRRAPADELFSSSAALMEALHAAASMGTANCMNPKNGLVKRGDYLAVRDQVRMETLPLL
jgi:tagatose 6-phosphate kinase